METQNAKECYNGQVWRRCHKSLATSLNTIETSVALASLNFNCGSSGFTKLMEELNIEPGAHLTRYATKSTARCISDASRKSMETSKKIKKRKKLVKAGLADKYQATKGVLYQSGGFNG